MAVFNFSQYPWFAGQNEQGVHVQNSPEVVTGTFQKQNGQYSFAPTVTAPGTIASAGTVRNSTGVDCLVYASATTGIGAIKVLNYSGVNTGTISPYGTVSSAATAAVVVPGPGAIAVTYTGSLSWVWQPL